MRTSKISRTQSTRPSQPQPETKTHQNKSSVFNINKYIAFLLQTFTLNVMIIALHYRKKIVKPAETDFT